jgi:hypothetical protein
MKKIKYFIDIDKEEKWLNELIERGYLLDSKSPLGVYRFKKVEDSETIIRLDYRTFKKKSEFENYKALFEDSGWNHIAGTKNSGTQYFMMKGNNHNQEIFSDKKSKALRYKRISNMWLSLFVVYSPLLIIFINNNVIDSDIITNPKALYLTPGLWEKTSIEFWKAFLFETPFALFRGVLWFAFPALLLMYFYFSIKLRLLYHEKSQ